MKRLILPLTLLLTAIGASACAQTEPSASDQFGFALHLFRERDYYRAITEFKRYCFLYPTGNDTDTAKYLVGLSFYKARRWHDARTALESSKLETLGPELRDRQHLLLMRCWIEDNELESARSWAADCSVSDDLRPYVGMLLALSYVQSRDVAGVDRTFRDLLSRYPSGAAAELSESVLYDTSEYFSHERKSPTTAMVLSAVLPGAGHVYAGNKADGFVALASVAIFSILAVDAERSGHDSTSKLLWLFNIGQYIGNIHGGRDLLPGMSTA